MIDINTTLATENTIKYMENVIGSGFVILIIILFSLGTGAFIDLLNKQITGQFTGKFTAIGTILGIILVLIIQLLRI